MKKVCPLSFDPRVGGDYCEQSGCEWWNLVDNECIIKTIAKSLWHIERSLEILADEHIKQTTNVME